MKKRSDPRHQKRIHLMQQLFSWQANPRKPSDEISKIIAHLETIDEKIAQAAPVWPIGQINKIDLAILRLSCFELLLERQAPPKVVIDEAVELAKEYGAEKSPALVNGVLGKLVEIEKIDTGG